MAELDIRGFVTPEQQINFDKLAETLNAQSAAKAKAEETKVAKKAALKKAFEGKFNTKDFLTGTVHDEHITNRVYDALEKVNKYVTENDGATESMVELFANPIVRSIATDSEKLKELERKRKEGEAYVSKIPGADPVKFNEYFKKAAYLSPDGTIPDDLSGLDITRDYGTYVLENAPIWNAGAIDNLITKAGSGSSTERVYTKDANKKVRESEIKIESPLHMKPILDKSGHFTGQFEMPHVILKDGDEIIQQDVIDESTGKPKLDAQNKPIKEPVKMLPLEDYETITQDKGANGYIRQKITEFGLDPDSTAGQNYGRKVAFEALNASSKAKTRFSELKGQAAAPITKINVSTGGGSGSKAPTINDVYSRLKVFVDDKLKKYKDNPNVYGKKDWVQINALDSDIRKVILAEARDATGNNDLGIQSIKIKVDDNGVMGIYDVKKNKLITQITEQGVNVAASVGTPSKNLVISKMKYKAKDGKTYTHAQLIDMGYTEDVIKAAKANGNLKNN